VLDDATTAGNDFVGRMSCEKVVDDLQFGGAKGIDHNYNRLTFTAFKKPHCVPILKLRGSSYHMYRVALDRYAYCPSPNPDLGSISIKLEAQAVIQNYTYGLKYSNVRENPASQIDTRVCHCKPVQSCATGTE